MIKEPFRIVKKNCPDKILQSRPAESYYCPHVMRIHKNAICQKAICFRWFLWEANKTAKREAI